MINTVKGYSLWLMPQGQVYERLNAIIKNLHKDYLTPLFLPHVTLLGELGLERQEMIVKTSRLAERLKPFVIRFQGPGYFKEYFKALFIKGEQTDQLLRAHTVARHIFDLKEYTDYMPHLSLLYGDIAESAKHKIIRDIGSELYLSFEVDSIHLISTDGAPDDWYSIGEFHFKQVRDDSEEQ